MPSFSSFPGLFLLYKLTQNLLLSGILSAVNPPGLCQPSVLPPLLPLTWLSLPRSSSSPLLPSSGIRKSLMCAGHGRGKSNRCVFSCKNRQVTPWLKEIVALRPAEGRAELLQLFQNAIKVFLGLQPSHVTCMCARRLPHTSDARVAPPSLQTGVLYLESSTLSLTSHRRHYFTWVSLQRKWAESVFQLCSLSGRGRQGRAKLWIPQGELSHGQPNRENRTGLWPYILQVEKV